MQNYDPGILHRYFLNNSSNRLHKWLHYFDIYERHLSKFRNHSPVILEIGVFGGGSLQMWLEYYGKGSKVVGLDIDPNKIMNKLDRNFHRVKMIPKYSKGY